MTPEVSHNAFPATPAARVCDTCGGEYTPRTRHATRFCSDRCRNAFHSAEARVENIRDRAVNLYAALQKMAGWGCEVPDGHTPDACPHCVAATAIKDLKPPVEPKALLEKAKA